MSANTFASFNRDSLKGGFAKFPLLLQGPLDIIYRAKIGEIIVTNATWIFCVTERT